MASVPYLKGKYYYTTFYQDGKVINRSLRTTSKTAAKILVSELEENLRRSRLGIKVADKQKRVKDLFDEMHIIYNMKKSYPTVRPIINRFQEYAGHTKLREIDRMFMEEYRNHLLSGGTMVAATVNKHIQHLKACFNHAVKSDMMLKDPTAEIKKLKPNKRDRLVHVDEQNLLLENADEPLKSYLIMASQTGGRLGELRRLKWRHLDFENKRIKLLAEKTEEGDRWVKMSKMVYDHFFDKNPGIKHQEDSALNQFIPNTMQRQLKKLREKLGIKGIGFHVFRHTYITKLAVANINATHIQRFAGHKDIATTMKYIHLNQDIDIDIDSII